MRVANLSNMPKPLLQRLMQFLLLNNVGLDPVLYAEFYRPVYDALARDNASVIHEPFGPQQDFSEWVSKRELFDTHPPEDMCPGNCFLCEGCME